MDSGGDGQTAIDIKLAETGGFEPPIRCDPYNGLANRRLQPLGHVSKRRNPYSFNTCASNAAPQIAHIARTPSIPAATEGGTVGLESLSRAKGFRTRSVVTMCAGTSNNANRRATKRGTCNSSRQEVPVAIFSSVGILPRPLSSHAAAGPPSKARACTHKSRLFAIAGCRNTCCTERANGSKFFDQSLPE